MGRKPNKSKDSTKGISKVLGTDTGGYDPFKIYAYNKKGKPVCGAVKTKNIKNGAYCQRPAGWGTDHAGTGRCMLHDEQVIEETGVRLTDRHGAYKTIYFDQLDEKEKEYIVKKQHDVESQIDWEVMFLDIRIRRMMQRIDKLYEEQMVIATSRVKKKARYDREEGRWIMQDDEIEKTLDNIGTTVAKWEDAITQLQRTKEKFLKLKLRLKELSLEEDSVDNMATLQEVIGQSLRQIAMTRRTHPVKGDDVATKRVEEAKKKRNMRAIERKLEAIQEAEREEDDI